MNACLIADVNDLHESNDEARKLSTKFSAQLSVLFFAISLSP